MKKKLIGLSTLLLVLLLGSFSTCYADVNRTWTDIELKNIIYKMAMNANPNYSTTYINFINSKSSDIQTIVNELNEYRWNAVGAISNYNALFIKITNYDYGWYVSRNQPILASGSWYKVYRIILNTNEIEITYDTADSSSSHVWADYRYIGRNTYNNTSWQTRIWSAGEYYPDNFFDEWHWTTRPDFSFVPKPADSSADVYYFEDVPLYNASGEDLYIGQLFVPSDSNISYWTKDNYYYRYGDWNLRQLSSDSLYLDFYTTDNDVAVYDVYLKSNYIYENTIYSSVWADDSTDPYTLAIGNFYIKNNNTSVVNGVIDASQTFSGDYKDKYDNEIQNEEDISNISEAITGTILDDSEVDNILGHLDTSGEVGAYFGYHDYTSDSDTVYFQPNLFITNVITDVIDELMRSGDRYFDYALPNGGYYRISSRFFTTPIEGKGSSAFIIVRWFLIFGSFYCLYRNFVEIGENLSTLNIHDVLNQVDDDRFIFRM